MDIYDILERFSTMTIDGGTTEAEALAYIRKTCPQDIYNELVAKLGTAPESAKGNPQSADFETLSQYIDFGFTLISSDNEARKINFKTLQAARLPADKKSEMGGLENIHEAAKIRTLQDLKTAADNGVMRFQFFPYEKKYLCIDIDRKHGSDGLANFYNLLSQPDIDARNGIFKDIEGGTFPTYATSPNGGIHLYFAANLSTWTQTHKPKTYLTHNEKKIASVDVIFSSTPLTAAGSVKTTESGKLGLYELHGDLTKAPKLPLFFARLLTQEKDESPKAQTQKTIESLIAQSKRKHYREKADAESAIAKAIQNCFYNGYSAANEAEITAELERQFSDLSRPQVDAIARKSFELPDGAEYIRRFFATHAFQKGDRNNGLARSCMHIRKLMQERKYKFQSKSATKELVISCAMQSGIFMDAERNEVIATVNSIFR